MEPLERLERLAQGKGAVGSRLDARAVLTYWRIDLDQKARPGFREIIPGRNPAGIMGRLKCLEQ
ncbi:MAG: hypothetical protein A3I00_04620 [Betaproteobacteria bacterium RIFCSPLOWO2_02_FULL_64_12]|nr:MAG: hypothetical protein A3I00_04620 [Betaproteobacteria bacterium RIFCSPLOWO2_02_FULL_64_12]